MVIALIVCSFVAAFKCLQCVSSSFEMICMKRIETHWNACSIDTIVRYQTVCAILIRLLGLFRLLGLLVKREKKKFLSSFLAGVCIRVHIHLYTPTKLRYSHTWPSKMIYRLLTSHLNSRRDVYIYKESLLLCRWLLKSLCMIFNDHMCIHLV